MGTFRFPSLVIAAGAQNSNILGGNDFDHIHSLSIHAPALLAGAVTVEVSDVDPDVAVDADFRTLQSGGADVAVTVSDTTVITSVSFRSLRLHESVAAGAGGETYDVTARDVLI